MPDQGARQRAPIGRSERVRQVRDRRRGATRSRDVRGQIAIHEVVFCAVWCGGDGLEGWLVYF
jgi:hypothetical protein